jgi:hypothetical protein
MKTESQRTLAPFVLVQRFKTVLSQFLISLPYRRSRTGKEVAKPRRNTKIRVESMLNQLLAPNKHDLPPKVRVCFAAKDRLEIHAAY